MPARSRARRALAAAAGAVLLTAAPAAARPADAPAPPLSPAPAVNADVDGDGLSQDLERALARRGAGARVDVILRLRGRATAARVGALEEDAGELAGERRYGALPLLSARVDARQAARLAALAEVVEVERDVPVRALNHEGAAWSGAAPVRVDAGVDGDGDGNPTAYGPADAVAAVIDTGIDANHRDLDGGKVIAFKDFVNGRTAAYDDEGHGTHVAATIAGDGDARSDRLHRGVAPRAALVGVKVLDAQGGGSMSDVIAGIDWVVTNRAALGVEAINLSLGASGCSDGRDSASTAVDAAAAAGLVVAVAAGNEGPGTCTVGSPAAAGGALSVGAHRATDARGLALASFSSRGPTRDGRVRPDVAAPGVGIVSARAGTVDGYTAMSGTSMATPFVAGVALLMLDADPGLTPARVRTIMRDTARDQGRGGDATAAGSRGADVDWGAGMLDAYAAVEAAAARDVGARAAWPTHRVLEGRLDNTGQVAEHTLTVTDTAAPLGITLVIPSATGGAGDPDFDLELIDPRGSRVAVAEASGRHDDLGVKPALGGDYVLRVRSYAGSGAYVLDVNGGIRATAGAPNSAPTAAFTAAPAAPLSGDPVTFTSTSADPDGRVVRHEWDLDGDGAFDDAEGITATRAYATPGTRTVRLRVVDDAGASAETSAVITVANRAPRAALAGPATVSDGAEAAFDASASTDSDGRIVAYSWDLDGDGTFETQTGDVPVARRVYRGPARLTVRVRVRDDAGATSEAAAPVEVTGPPAAEDPATTPAPDPIAEEPPPPKVSLGRPKRDRRGRLAVRVACGTVPAGPCRGVVEAFLAPRSSLARLRLRARAAAGKRARRSDLVVARAAFDVPAGRARTVTLPLPAWLKSHARTTPVALRVRARAARAGARSAADPVRLLYRLPR